MTTHTNLKTIISVAGLMMTVGFGTFSGWIYTYHDRFVVLEDHEEYKKREKLKDSLKSLDDSKEHTFILITMFELKGLSNLTEEQRAVYDRTNALLITLQADRDAIINRSGT